LQVGRRAFKERVAIVCGGREEAVRLLRGAGGEAQAALISGTVDNNKPSLVFMFPGQGAQYAGMGTQLYAAESVFRVEVDRCAQYLQPHLGIDLRNLLYPPDGQVDAAMQRIEETLMAQVTLFVTEYALAQLWRSWGVVPQTMIGHSLGEYVAATLAGVFTLPDALALVVARGQMMQALPGGAMLAVRRSELELQVLMRDRSLSLAAVNGPTACVVSGSHEAIKDFEQQLVEENILHRRLHTSHAFHSEAMEAILEPFGEQVSRFKLSPPTIPYISNVSGQWVTAAEATAAAYWVRHLRAGVRFGDGLATL
ncbi:MAG: acyltransferase domain-containing protein, partial [Acidobacteria bacterium]|nr:acyltransferase domain-containing protein [Acidobacteriota bacterium]